MTDRRPSTFRFKQFALSDSSSAMKIGTDGVALGAWAFSGFSPRRILDVGAGSGLISLMMAQRFPTADITGIEIDSPAACEASENVRLSPWASRVEILNADFLNCALPRFDAIVSNPPFFTTGQLAPDSNRARARHEASLPLHRLIVSASELLIDGGRLALILPAERLDSAIYTAAISHLDARRVAVIRSVPDSQPFRAMVEFTKGLADTYISEEIIIRDTSGHYAPCFASLTADFYL